MTAMAQVRISSKHYEPALLVERLMKSEWKRFFNVMDDLYRAFSSFYFMSFSFHLRSSMGDLTSHRIFMYL